MTNNNKSRKEASVSKEEVRSDDPVKTMTTNAIELDNIVKRYDETTAVKDVSIEIKQNEFFTLLGPSGSGKTTLLRLIAGFTMPTEGSISINGKDVTSKQPQDRATATVFQNYALFPHMTVAENVCYGLDIRGVSDKEKENRLKDTLSLLEIEPLRDRKPEQLSGGQQQRVALARGLILEPDIFLLDEPLSALDEKLRQNMRVELKSLQEKVGITFIYVTHDQEEAMTMSDRIAVLNQGQVVEADTVEQLYRSPQKEFTANFFGAGNILPVSNVYGLNNDLVTVNIDGDKYQARKGTASQDKEGYAISVRPRDLIIKTEPSHENSIQGVVEESVYIGEGHQYHIRIFDGVKIECMSDNPSPFEEGQEVFIGWNSEDAVLVEAAKGDADILPSE